MFCNRCSNDLVRCTCPDIDERLAELRPSPFLALRWCEKCDRHADRCICPPAGSVQ